MRYIMETEDEKFWNIVRKNEFFGKYIYEEKFKKLNNMQQGYFVALVAKLGLVAYNHFLDLIRDPALKSKIRGLYKSQTAAALTKHMNYQFLQNAGFEVSDKTISPIEEVVSLAEEGLAGKFITYSSSRGRYTSEQNELARILSSRIAIVNDEEDTRFFGYNGQIYERVTDEIIKKACREIINETHPNAWCHNLEREYLDAYRHEMPTTKDLKSGRNAVAFDNGLFDLETGVFMDFKPAYFITSKVDYEYDETADCPRFRTFLEEIFSEDMERVNFIQQLMGYLLVYDRSIPYIYILVSSGRSGKSVLTSIIGKMLGTGKVSHTPLKKLNDNFGLQSLKGSHLNISSESELDSQGINTEQIKAISGGDIIEVERKYQDPEALDLGTRLVISTNQNLKFNDKTDAIKERLVFVPFDHKYLADPGEAEKEGCRVADPQLNQKLDEELAGIFNFAYGGLQQVRANGMRLDIPEICKEKRGEFKNYNNPIKVFVEEHIELEAESSVSRRELRDAFEHWQDDYSSCVQINTSQVAAQILAHIKKENPTVNFIDKKFSDSRVTEGIRLRDIS